ncbi:replication protein [Moraxella ovis]|uniref:Replication protein n=1 Tax=Moraxella ovis TaxID=29433 RepID=A0A378QCU1_9GAMM|nr:replication initiation protein RepM [Moraxella ovis]STY98615.1 replication protein [Moraxella ovis]
MSKNLVVKDNALINASYSLDLIEQRLILLAIAQARQTGQELTATTKIHISVSDYIDVYSVQGRSVYENIKGACKTLFERQFSYTEQAKKGVRIATSRWVSEIAYNTEQSSVDMTFAPAVVPLITMLEKHFTSYDLEQVAGLNSKYATRLYEIIIAWRNKGETPQIDVGQLRGRLGIKPHEYPIMADFKKRVLDTSVKEITNKTDIVISYDQHKQGRKIVGFTFAIKTKSQAIKTKKDSDSRDTNTFDMLAPVKMTDKQRAYFASKLSELSELGHLAPAGADYAEYAKKIEKELLDTEKAEFYRPYLEKLGFKA